jgi:Uma2 family endonuclease
MRSPDLAWVLRERLATIRPKQKRTFLRLVPDLAIELASPTDDSDGLRAKMREWRDNGVRLGWLILPEQRQVWRYAQGVEPVCLDNPAQIGDEALLPGLALPLERIWEPGF